MALALMFAVVLVGLALFGALLVCGSLGMRKLVLDGRRIIDSEVKSTTANTGSTENLSNVPPPVARFLNMSGALRGQQANRVFLKQAGAIRINEKSGWSKMRAEQWFSGLSPAFVWHATAKPFPLLWVEARDSLLNGKGGMLIKLFSLFTVADARGPEVDISSLVRYGSEMPWFPSSMRPSSVVKWEGIDDSSAKMIIREGSLAASLVFTINEKGEITRMDSEDRYSDGQKKEPWIVRYQDYKEMDGFRIPMSGEAAWKTRHGEFVYIRLRISEIAYSRVKTSEK